MTFLFKIVCWGTKKLWMSWFLVLNKMSFTHNILLILLVDAFFPFMEWKSLIMTTKKSTRVEKKRVLGNELYLCSLHNIKFLTWLQKINTLGTHQKNTDVGLMSPCIKYMVFSLSLGQKYNSYVHQGHLMSPTSASRLNRIFLPCRLHCILLYDIQKCITQYGSMSNI